MSYILQALKRAQDERESGVVATRPRPATVKDALRHSWWPWAIAAALLVNAGALVVFSSSDRTVPRGERSGEGSRQGAVDRGATGSDSGVSPGERGSSVPAPEAAPRVTAESRGRTGGPRPVEGPRLTASPRPTARTAPSEPRRSAPTGPSEPAPRVVLTKPIEAPIAQTQSSEPTPGIAPSPYPGPGSSAPPPPQPAPAASSAREAFQALTLQALVYADTRSQRMVFINGRKYVEGDTVADRFVLEQVTPEGAVLSANGERFVLQERGR
jgi:general secretion pathway protein B